MSAPAHTTSEEPVAEDSRRHPLVEWAWGLVRLDFVGVAVGALFFCLSLTPSLLPRDWLFQGIIGGFSAAIGYAIGVVVGKLFHRFVLRGRSWWPPAKPVQYWLKAATVALSAAASLLMLIPAAGWQRQVSGLMGVPAPDTTEYLRTVVVAVGVGGASVGVARVLLDIIKTLARWLIRRWRLNDEVALFIGTAIVVVLLVTLINGVLMRGAFFVANQMFAPQNSATPEGVSQPQEPERSGSPMSLAPWDTLGYQGRKFVGGGPHADELTRINGRPAKEPIRVYAGLQTADTERQRMDIVVRELERTGAFDRKVLVVIPTTGTGWVNPLAARAVEMMYNGDTALVGMQYSYLPSWVSFVADREKSMRAGRLMIDTISKRWMALPPERRPKLVLYGESLGSMAGQAAFDWLPDIARMGFSAVLWVGPPNASPLWRAVVERRDPGTSGDRPALRQRPHRAVLRGAQPGEIAARHRRAVARHQGAVPAASFRSGGVVVTGTAVLPARLAGGAGRR